MYLKCLLFSVLYLGSFQANEACKGCLSLDEFNIHKIIPKFGAVLVKFDIAYPYGEKQEAFEKVAADIAGSKDLILGQVGIKDYGEKDNEDLGKKYGIMSKEQLPELKLFVQGKEEPISFSKDKAWNVDEIRYFIKQNSDIYIGLSGCLEVFDKLALEFMTSSTKEEKVKEAEKLTVPLKNEEKLIASTYIKFMKKIVENGVNFVKQETTRLNKILKDGKLNDKKKKELLDRLNVLQSFVLPKDEL